MRQIRIVAPRQIVRDGYGKPLIQKVLAISKRSKKDALALEQIADFVIARLDALERRKRSA